METDRYRIPGDDHYILKELVDAFDPEVDLRSYADFILKLMERQFGFRKILLKLISIENEGLFIAAHRGLSNDFVARRPTEIGSGISGKVAVNGKSMIVKDLINDENTTPYAKIYEKEGVTSLLSLPIAKGDAIIGVLNIYDNDANRFTQENVVSISNIISSAASFLSFLYQNDNLRDKLDRVQRYNKRLEQLKSFHELIIENIPIGVVATNEKGYVVLMNRVLERMSLQQREECMGKRWIEVFGFEGGLKYRLETSFRTSSPQLFPEINLPLRDGSVLPVEMKTDVIRDHSGSGIGVVAICSDISEKKKAEREIEKIERLVAIGRLSAGIAHEIRNPLAGISGALQVINSRVSGDVELEGVLKRVFREINRLDNVVEKLHGLASPKKLTFEPHSISDVVEDSLFFIEKPLQSRKIRLIKRLEKGLNPLMMDRDAIQQVVINVMINAMNSMRKGGDLTVETVFLESISVLEPDIMWHNSSLNPNPTLEFWKKPPSYAAIVVADKGIGIPQTVVPRIFEAFFSTFRGGTGLGLYISARIVEQHHGIMGVRSRKGEGSVFYILLPAES
ncbi:MAG: ATP-binding protein [Thermodesulfobacteriota bacterium]|nr:ATP-binding protein [Thermodesulfobacteriota bacterium]